MMMKARHFGASSYDDDYDEEEDGPMDMSGFMTSSETQPPVIERPRSRSNPPPQGNPPQGMGNLGPKTVAPPRPVSNMGYTPKMVSNAADNSGSPWNPLWAHDETLGPNWLPVASKTGGLGLVASSVLLAQGWKAWGPRTRMMAFTGALMYAHPVLGLGHGMLNQYIGEKGVWTKFAVGGLTHVIPLGTYFVYRRHIKK